MGTFDLSNIPPHAYAQIIKPLHVTRSNSPVPALFLDRDGVINVDRGYTYKCADLIIRDGICAIIAQARCAGYETVIVTNQSGIGRGYYTWRDFEKFQREIYCCLKAINSESLISMVCACPFHENATPPYQVLDHFWRKPNPGMILFASGVLNIDLAASFMIGDQKSDAIAAKRAGIRFEYARALPKIKFPR